MADNSTFFSAYSSGILFKLGILQDHYEIKTLTFSRDTRHFRFRSLVHSSVVFYHMEFAMPKNLLASYIRIFGRESEEQLLTTN
jgi:hypothetical protein